MVEVSHADQRGFIGARRRVLWQALAAHRVKGTAHPIFLCFVILADGPAGWITFADFPSAEARPGPAHVWAHVVTLTNLRARIHLELRAREIGGIAVFVLVVAMAIRFPLASAVVGSELLAPPCLVRTHRQARAAFFVAPVCPVRPVVGVPFAWVFAVGVEALRRAMERDDSFRGGARGEQSDVAPGWFAPVRPCLSALYWLARFVKVDNARVDALSLPFGHRFLNSSTFKLGAKQRTERRVFAAVSGLGVVARDHVTALVPVQAARKRQGQARREPPPRRNACAMSEHEAGAQRTRVNVPPVFAAANLGTYASCSLCFGESCVSSSNASNSSSLISPE